MRKHGIPSRSKDTLVKQTKEEKEARRLRYYQAHREEIIARSARYYREHKEQIAAYHIQYRAAHKELRREQTRAHRMAHPEVFRASYLRHKHSRTLEQIEKKKRSQLNWRLKREYGITIAERDEMLSSPGQACAICGGSDWGAKGPCVDHDHKTGRARGLLCHWCNAALGLIKESQEIAKNIIEYLNKTKEPSECPTSCA